MRERRHLTSEFKLEAVKLAEGGGVPVAQVARELGLHETTLHRWVRAAVTSRVLHVGPRAPLAIFGAPAT